jgi:non-canonical (house-cleaning) NTP pyrophosphatase
MESGLVPFDGITFDFGACAIYDGKKTNCGTTSGFVIPTRLVWLIHQGNDLSQAGKLAGITNNPKIV